ncbi:hypothetical protein VTK56DRAFT_2515 [Thermocarpiscus australiensis]
MAALSTDTGHSSAATDTSWARNQPEKKTDWGWRALHGSTVLGKKLVRAYYGGRPPKYSYYSGCSTGGRQGLKEIQTFPDSFDGALIGAPAWWTTHLNTYIIQVKPAKVCTSEVDLGALLHPDQQLMMSLQGGPVQSAGRRPKAHLHYRFLPHRRGSHPPMRRRRRRPRRHRQQPRALRLRPDHPTVQQREEQHRQRPRRTLPHRGADRDRRESLQRLAQRNNQRRAALPRPVAGRGRALVEPARGDRAVPLRRGLRA